MYLEWKKLTKTQRQGSELSVPDRYSLKESLSILSNTMEVSETCVFNIFISMNISVSLC